jgi:hypothetical protein
MISCIPNIVCAIKNTVPQIGQCHTVPVTECIFASPAYVGPERLPAGLMPPKQTMVRCSGTNLKAIDPIHH